MRDKPGCQDIQKHLKEREKDCWNKGKEESDVNVCEGEVKKK